MSARDQPRRSIGISPAAAGRRPALLAALEEAFPVTFQVGTGGPALDGLIEFGASHAGAERFDCPRLTLLSEAAAADPASAEIEFAADPSVARPLRGRTMRGQAVPPADAQGPGEGDTLLATGDGRALWWARAGARGAWAHVSAMSPREIGEGEVLRDQLSGERFMGLVPLLHLLREVCAGIDWDRQPLRASFIVDDPNLHWPSYGYLDYAQLVRHADRHGYHVGFAMVPADGWLANRRAASLVRDNPGALSLLIHGNDHASDELGRLTGDRQAEAVLAQALRRTAAFERRSGVAVQRVMVPPHEACSMTALKAMCRLGFDAACIGRRHPWKGYEPAPSAAGWPLMRWHPTDLIDGALPILPRYLIDRPREELALRALLGQPLILFGHHWDFAGGLDLLAEAAGYVNGLGDVQWGPAAWIAANSFLSRREGETLAVQMHARRIALEVPEGVAWLRVTTPRSWGERSSRLTTGEAEPATAGASAIHRDRVTVEHVRVRGGTRIQLELKAQHPLDPAGMGPPRSAAWPAGRRALVAARDRTLPLRRRLSVG